MVCHRSWNHEFFSNSGARRERFVKSSSCPHQLPPVSSSRSPFRSTSTTVKRVLEGLEPIPPALRWEAHSGSPVSTLCALEKTPLLVTASTDSTVKLFTLADVQVFRASDTDPSARYPFSMASWLCYFVDESNTEIGPFCTVYIHSCFERTNLVSQDKLRASVSGCWRERDNPYLSSCTVAHRRWEPSRSRPRQLLGRLTCVTRKAFARIARSCERHKNYTLVDYFSDDHEKT